MLREYEVVIADTSCFILLDNIDEIQILKKVFSTITTTETIAAEFGKSLPEWVNILSVQNKSYQSLLELEVDPGEASAIALAVENNALLIIDDLKARKLAERLYLNYTGTLGVFLKAKELKIYPSIKPVLNKIQLTSFRFSQKVFEEIIRIAGEN